MTSVKHWTVDIYINETEGKTAVQARLTTDSRSDITGTGHAKRNPIDPDIPEIGAELATARALSELAHRLFDVTVHDIESVTHEPATLSQ